MRAWYGAGLEGDGGSSGSCEPKRANPATSRHFLVAGAGRCDLELEYKKATPSVFLWELSQKPSDTLDISRHVTSHRFFRGNFSAHRRSAVVTTQPRVAVHIGARWTTWTPAFALFPWISGRSSFPTSSTSKRDRYWRGARRFGRLFPGPGLCRGLSTTRG